MTEARLIEIAQYRIAEALAKLECELQCVVDGVEIEETEITSIADKFPAYTRRVRLQLRKIGGWECAASSILEGS